MKSSLASLSVAALLVVTVSLLHVGQPAPARPASPAQDSRLVGHVPVAFVPNVGQWEHSAPFVARVGAMTLFLEPRGWTFTLVERSATSQGAQAMPKESDRATERGVAVRMTFAGTNAPELAPELQLPGRHHYFLGSDPARWRSDVPLWGAVRYRGVHPGIDVVARTQDGHFEYDLVLEPGATLAPVEIAVAGTDGMHVDGAGALVLATRVGPVRMPVPTSWEEGPSGEKRPIACRYVLRGTDRFGFEAPGRRPDWRLVVDPGLLWSTFLGGAAVDYPFAVAVDDQGATTVVGGTGSTDFPTTPGAFDRSYNGGPIGADVIVTRLAADGSRLVWSTFLGGEGSEVALALALDVQGAVTLAGKTASFFFPTTAGAADATFNGRMDAFVARLSPTGSSLVFASYLGGTDYDSATALAVDAQGVTTVAGYAGSPDFPVTSGAFDESYNGVADAFVTRLSPTGSQLVWSTFVGGSGAEWALGLALDAQGGVTIAGGSDSVDFPTTSGAFDGSSNGGFDAFVTRLSATGSDLVCSTLLGGAQSEYALAVRLDAKGSVTVAGWTSSSDLPTTPGALGNRCNGPTDGFVTRFSPTGTSLLSSTFLGGSGEDSVNALAVDALGNVTLTGRTASTDFPTTAGAFSTHHNGGALDAFVTRISPAGNLVYSTYLGGTSDDVAMAMVLDGQGAATVAGGTWSADFPTTPGAFDRGYHGLDEIFVTRLDLLPGGVTAFGRSSSGCAGPLAISVTSMPRVGNAAFALTCGNAPRHSAGVVPLAGAGLTAPLPVLGIELWVDPLRLWLLPITVSDGVGMAELALPVPPDQSLVGAGLYAQFVWVGPNAPTPCPPLGVSASNALAITIQP